MIIGREGLMAEDLIGREANMIIGRERLMAEDLI